MYVYFGVKGVLRPSAGTTACTGAGVSFTNPPQKSPPTEQYNHISHTYTYTPRIVDNLPVATRVKSELRPDEVYYVRGFPVGAALDGKHFLFNHIKLIISYNEDHSPGTWVGRWVGVGVSGVCV